MKEGDNSIGGHTDRRLKQQDRDSEGESGRFLNGFLCVIKDFVQAVREMDIFCGFNGAAKLLEWPRRSETKDPQSQTFSRCPCFAVLLTTCDILDMAVLH